MAVIRLRISGMNCAAYSANVERALANVEAGKVNCVMVYKTDRLSRSLYDGLMVIQMLRDRDVELVSITEKIDAPESLEKKCGRNEK